jgi:hypothetical protein
MREREEGREIYRQRYKIEQVIGLLKRSYVEGCRERNEEMAKKAIMMRAVLWNMAVLMVSGFLLFRWLVLEGGLLIASFHA